MSDLLSDAQDWLDGQRHDHLSGVVTYSRSGSEEVTVAATPQQRPYQATDDYGHVTEVQMRDFLIRAADLAEIAAPFTPALGDTITEAGRVYIVACPPAKNHFDWWGPSTYRLHTKLIEG